MKPISQRIADDMGVGEPRIQAAIRLLDEGATVPFIARYRKEATDGLSDIHLRHLQARLGSLRDLDERRETVLRSIGEQGKLTPQMERALLDADTRTRIEDLYLPYRPQRRTRAFLAREAGLEPLARHLLDHPSDSPDKVALKYVDPSKGIADGPEALEGARHILVDILSEEAELVGRLREILWQRGLLRARVVKGKEAEGAKFADYF
ncbi:MAG: RNA-binding transcriptional accessory protein, partial [SAR324 cluster bacterium]|nr:RNA-binding transcriptional accessory protein [SAR324 cluster bacterium]